MLKELRIAVCKICELSFFVTWHMSSSDCGDPIMMSGQTKGDAFFLKKKDIIII
jgi:hypothetical protein